MREHSERRHTLFVCTRIADRFEIRTYAVGGDGELDPRELVAARQRRHACSRK
jgi:hypothetical protein